MDCANNKINYTIFAGDTFVSSIAIKENGELLDPAIVRSLIFKLSKDDYKEIYRQEFVYSDADNKWFLNVPSEVTSTFEIDTYLYEYELTLVDGYVTTIMQAKFKVKSDIKE